MALVIMLGGGTPGINNLLEFAMFYKALKVVSTAVVMMGATQGAVAATLDFDGLSVGSYTNPGPSNQYFEDGFYYRLDGIDAATGTSGVELQRTPGAVAFLGSRTSFWGPTLYGGFTFGGVDWRAQTQGAVATINVAGRDFQSGLWFTDVFSTASDAFQTFGAVNLAGVVVDQLWIEIDDGNTAFGALDNLVLNPVNVHPAPIPLPAAGMLLLTALGAGAAMRRRNTT